MLNLSRWAVVCAIAAFVHSTPLVAQNNTSHVTYVIEVEAPEKWATIYHEAETCVGQVGDFASVSWFVMFEPITGLRNEHTWGLWRVDSSDSRQIITYRGDPEIVRHEVLHDILYLNGFVSPRTEADSLSTDPEHPMPPFGRCALRHYEPTR